MGRHWIPKTVLPRPPLVGTARRRMAGAPLGPHGGGVLSGLSDRKQGIYPSEIPGTKPLNPIQFFRISEKPQGAESRPFWRLIVGTIEGVCSGSSRLLFGASN